MFYQVSICLEKEWFHLFFRSRENAVNHIHQYYIRRNLKTTAIYLKQVEVFVGRQPTKFED